MHCTVGAPSDSNNPSTLSQRADWKIMKVSDASILLHWHFAPIPVKSELTLCYECAEVVPHLPSFGPSLLWLKSCREKACWTSGGHSRWENVSSTHNQGEKEITSTHKGKNLEMSPLLTVIITVKMARLIYGWNGFPVDSIAISIFVDILVELTSIRSQDPNNFSDSETRGLVYFSGLNLNLVTCQKNWQA